MEKEANSEELYKGKEVEWMDVVKYMPPVRKKSCFCCTKVYAPKTSYYNQQSVIKAEKIKNVAVLFNKYSGKGKGKINAGKHEAML